MRIDGNRRLWTSLGGAVLALAAALLLGNSAATAGDSTTKVKAFAAAGPIDAAGRQAVTITLLIDKDWHIYANPVKNKDFDPIKTDVKIGAKVKPARVDIRYPAGKLYPNKFNIAVMVYEERVDIPALVQRAPGDASPLEIDVTFSACDDYNCLAPATVRLKPR